MSERVKGTARCEACYRVGPFRLIRGEIVCLDCLGLVKSARVCYCAERAVSAECPEHGL
jgi:hypothetical protein